MKVEAIQATDYASFENAFIRAIQAFINEDPKVDTIISQYLTEIFNKYEMLEMHYIGEWKEEYTHDNIKEILSEIVRVYWYRKMPELLAMTNNLAEFSVIPINDSTVKDFEQNANTFSMSENQPIDATENVTTPYIKVKGKTGYKNKETTTHNTVKEALERVAISKETEMCLTAFIEAGIYRIVREYNTAY